MTAEPEANQTFTVGGPLGTVAFDRARRVFLYTPKGTNSLSPRSIAEKYPGPAWDALTMLLDATDYFLKDADFDTRAGYGVSLTAILSDIWKVIATLTGTDREGKQQRPWRRVGSGIETKRGYRLDSGFVKAPLSAHSVSLDIPNFRWVKEMKAHIVEGDHSVNVQTLPGNGAEYVQKILKVLFPEAETIRIELSSMKSAKDFLAGIAANRDLPQQTSMSRRMGPVYHTTARAAAGDKELLLVVIEGWGQFARLRGSRALFDLGLAICGFKTVTRPKVRFAMLSPVPFHHLFPSSKPPGSMATDFASVKPIPQDAEILEKWARERLSVLSERNLERVIRVARGQFGALKRAVTLADLPLKQILEEVRARHEEAGASILGSLGPCCAKSLEEKTGQCLERLRTAGIIERTVSRNIVPCVREWSTSWGKAWEEL